MAVERGAPLASFEALAVLAAAAVSVAMALVEVACSEARADSVVHVASVAEVSAALVEGVCLVVATEVRVASSAAAVFEGHRAAVADFRAALEMLAGSSVMVIERTVRTQEVGSAIAAAMSRDCQTAAAVTRKL